MRAEVMKSPFAEEEEEEEAHARLLTQENVVVVTIINGYFSLEALLLKIVVRQIVKLVSDVARGLLDGLIENALHHAW